MSDSIVTAGFEIVPVLIFLVVISKIFGAIKKASSGTQPKSGAGAGQPGVAQDLQKFFENIANQQEAPPPVPVARKARAIPKARVAEALEPQPAAAVPAPYQTDSKPWSGRPFGPDVPERSTCSVSPSQSRAELLRMLKNGDSVRKAVLLREILGPPVSMRT